jgi:RNA polymerase sigma-70 factor, ECF subfamily
VNANSQQAVKQPSVSPDTESPLQLSGDQFGEVFRNCFRRTVSFVASLGAPGDSAEEIAQAAWVKGWECREQLRNVDSVAAWINSIAKNMLKRQSYESQRQRSLSDSQGTSHLDFSPILASTLLEKCRESDRNVLRRHYIEGYTTEEIASEIGLTPTAIRLRLLRARRALNNACRLPQLGRSFQSWQLDPALSDAA